MLKDTTLLVTNYQRPANVLKIVERFKDFMPIHILNNNPSYHIPKNFYVQKIYNNSVNKWCIERWYCALQCKTEYVCLLDDDIDLYRKTIFDLRKKIKRFPNSLIGICGKKGINNTYQELERIWCENAEVEIISGKCMMIRVDALRKIFSTYIIPLGEVTCGDDIIVSLSLSHYHKVLHYTVETEVDELPQYNVGLPPEYEKRWKIIQEYKEKLYA